MNYKADCNEVRYGARESKVWQIPMIIKFVHFYLLPTFPQLRNFDPQTQDKKRILINSET